MAVRCGNAAEPQVWTEASLESTLGLGLVRRLSIPPPRSGVRKLPVLAVSCGDW
jgi:hypothetical protein